MHTLYLRYTVDPNRIAAFETYVANEVPVIQRCGGRVIGYFLPTDFAGPTDTAHGLIDFDSFAEYETYRATLAADEGHKRNAAALTGSGALRNIERTFIRRAG